MGLTEYKRKRTLKKTPEPAGGKPAGKTLQFVVQKHAASRLHYDFRLELNGVLLSWAIPKGPSLNPADKRLAVHVEDHPFDYKDFEGVIPEGNYGAGTVIVWDRGTYEPLEPARSKTEKQKLLTRDFEKGSLKFRMDGEKLKGEFALVKMKGREADSWLLIKHRDEFASNEDIAEMDTSVVSGKTLQEVAASRKSKTWFRPNPLRAHVVWLRPKLVAEVTYRALGADGGMRHPSFKGLRADKDAREVRRELPTETNELVKHDKDHSLKKRLLTSVAKEHRKTLLNPGNETQVRQMNGHELKFTNLSKVYWPEHGYTKRDMLNYYYQVTPLMLPYMKDRPQTLNRFPNGIHGKSFYQKDVTGKVPGWIETYQYFSEGDQRQKHFMVCTDEASLLYLASLGCIEMNPWSSRVDKPDHPDWCVIDLDPDKKTTFDQVIEAALATREVLDMLELPSYCKTSGSTGLHIYIPLGAKYTYEESKEFARALVKLVHARLPTFTSLERKVSDRKGKMYLDFLQNRPQATLAGPYSLRPKPGAPVSTPLHWDEVRKGLRILDFTIKNAMSRFRETGDLFDGVLTKTIDMGKALGTIQHAVK